MARKDIQQVIEHLWPDGVAELSVDFEDSWFVKVRPKLTRALRTLTRIPTTLRTRSQRRPHLVVRIGPEPEATGEMRTRSLVSSLFPRSGR